ncbi:hypothetical protein HYDPIDRAFT_35492 [Hydnomerulius pinastri MD-312]|nr:hypothetical protein HYDPIDRAFT_35492 [Hydnomerulius pinastri MD-312]
MSSNGNLEDPRMIVWFDIDNTLYSARTKISQAMGEKIHEYFVNKLNLGHEEASKLHHAYYTKYGLALRGLTEHHPEIDPLDFDKNCDQTLELETLIEPNPSLNKLFEDLDRSKVRVWALTNAYIDHAKRVLGILGLQDQIEEIVYCHYEQRQFLCKPDAKYFEDAMDTANISDKSKCLFIDDSKTNVLSAKKLGWGRVVLFHEEGLDTMEGGKMKKLGHDAELRADMAANGIDVISNLEELRRIWPDIFKLSNGTCT